MFSRTAGTVGNDRTPSITHSGVDWFPTLIKLHFRYAYLYADKLLKGENQSNSGAVQSPEVRHRALLTLNSFVTERLVFWSSFNRPLTCLGGSEMSLVDFYVPVNILLVTLGRVLLG